MVACKVVGAGNRGCTHHLHARPPWGRALDFQKSPVQYAIVLLWHIAQVPLMCNSYITPRVYNVTTRVRHACTPRVYATRVHHACTPRPGYRPRHAAIWHCPYRYELYMKSTAVCSYEEYGGMPIGRVRLYTYMKSTVVCPYEE